VFSAHRSDHGLHYTLKVPHDTLVSVKAYTKTSSAMAI